MERWYDSSYTGLFTSCGPILPRPHDPSVFVWSGTMPPWGARSQEMAVGGAGWDESLAFEAGIGEALERLQPYATSMDQTISASYQDWPLDEPAVPPEKWVLFHTDQYRQEGFLFSPFTNSTACEWTCFRDVMTGGPCWVPAELAYLCGRPGVRHTICPAVSTGLSCGRAGQPVLLRGVQEVIERDAVVGAWWGAYPLEEWPADDVRAVLGPQLARRILRPNLTYRFYRVASPFSAHVTIVSVEGDDQEGYCFSVGSACRETREASWRKAILEAVHGRHYVRYLLQDRGRLRLDKNAPPLGFEQHAVYYSLNSSELGRTVLRNSSRPVACPTQAHTENLGDLVARLGPGRPVLFRNLTPPGIAQELPEWYVLRVLVPGLQPLHGNHCFPHLGGELWAPRGLAAWRDMPPHPFP